jgi:DNA-binding response OmpR family regulator
VGDGEAKKVIVVVEDDKRIAELIKDVLYCEPSYAPVAVHDGWRALELIHSVEPSLILLDVRLPGLNGLEVYDRLQADNTTLDIPVIFVTANSEATTFKGRNIPNYIAKPFDPDELLVRVAAALEPALQP